MELSQETRLQIRNGVLEYISNDNSLITPSQGHLRTAISRVIVSIIEHEYPEQWPDMFSQFTSILADPNVNYMVQCQMIFVILKRLIENCYTLITIENSTRRKEIQNGVSIHIGEVIAVTVQTLRRCISMGSSSEEAVLLANSGIELLSEIFDWVSGKVRFFS